MTEHNFEQMRRAMVTGQLRTSAVNDPRVVAAMASVPREDYVPADRIAFAYLDLSVAVGDGRAMPAPMVVGRLLTEARVRPADVALVIGAGSGYSAAVLAALCARVVALDVAGAPAGPLAPSGVFRVHGPLAEGWPGGGPYDIVLIDGAVEEVPDGIVAQLADGGRIATGLVRGGVTRLAIGRGSGAGGFGLTTFADADVPVLPGFARPGGFRF